MYESPVILAIGNNDPDSCGTPAIFGNCDVYCSVTNAYCVMITVYNQFCVSIEYTCLPESLFNDCTYYGCSGFICPGTWT